MTSYKNDARIVGLLFITATAAGILSAISVGSNLNSPVDLSKISTNEVQVILGAFFYFILALAAASIVVPMYPILKKYNETFALGAVAFRIIEGVAWTIGVISLLLLVTLSQEFVEAGAPADSYYQTIGTLFLEGANISGALVVGGIAFSLAALMYNYIFFQEKLIPRWLSAWGLISAALVLILNLFDLFGVFSEIAVLLNFPNFVGEMVLAVWLIIKGFDIEE